MDKTIAIDPKLDSQMTALRYLLDDNRLNDRVSLTTVREIQDQLDALRQTLMERVAEVTP